MGLYHNAKGPVDYTIVGSPTIVDGVLSDSSQANYITVNIPNSTTINTLEFNVKIKAQRRISYLYHGWDIFFNFFSENSGLVSTQSPASNFQRYLTVADGTNCNLNAVYDASTLTWTATLTNLDTQETATQTWQLNSAQDYSGTWYLGNHSWDNNNTTVGGEVDLNQTYIKVNGQPWFGVCPIEVKKHQLMGPVGYTLVGSPTITDGIAGNFSGTDYVITSQVLETGQQDTFEFKTKFVKTAAASLPLFFNTGRFVCSGATGQPPYIALRNYGENQGSYGSAWTAFKGTATQGFNTNTPYWVRMGHDGSYIYLDVSTDGTNYNNWISVPTKISSGATSDWVAPTVTGSPQTALGFAPTDYYLHGTMDLNETSITKNGKLWFWQPQSTKYIIKDNKLIWADPALYLSGPVAYEVVGSPTINNGIATGLNQNNYIQSTHQIDTSKPFEVVIDLTLNSSEFTTNNEFTGKIANMLMYVMKGNKKFEIGLQNGGWLTSTTQMTLGGNYKVKISYDGTDATLAVDSGSGFTVEATASSPAFTDKGLFLIGGHGSWNGSINMNNTYGNFAQVVENSVPVPSGYTYGTTTTSAIGWVNIPTQVFTAAPAGATIEREE